MNSRRRRGFLAILLLALSSARAFAQTDPLPSWDEGPAIFSFEK